MLYLKLVVFFWFFVILISFLYCEFIFLLLKFRMVMEYVLVMLFLNLSMLLFMFVEMFLSLNILMGRFFLMIFMFVNEIVMWRLSGIKWVCVLVFVWICSLIKFCMKNMDFKCEYCILLREKLYGKVFGERNFIFCDKGLVFKILILYVVFLGNVIFRLCIGFKNIDCFSFIVIGFNFVMRWNLWYFNINLSRKVKCNRFRVLYIVFDFCEMLWFY